MLTTAVTHPELLRALAAAGHGSQVLVADGNYPVATGARPEAPRVFLNLAPGVVDAVRALDAVAQVIPIEEAAVMATGASGSPEPPIWERFRALLRERGHDVEPLAEIDRHAFYELARGADLALVIATGETATYANLLLTVGVREAPSDGG